MNACGPLPFSGTKVAGQRPLNSSRAGQERSGGDSTSQSKMYKVQYSSTEKSEIWLPSENEKEADDRFATLRTLTLTWQIQKIEPPLGTGTS